MKSIARIAAFMGVAIYTALLVRKDMHWSAIPVSACLMAIGSACGWDD